MAQRNLENSKMTQDDQAVDRKTSVIPLASTFMIGLLLGGLAFAAISN